MSERFRSPNRPPACMTPEEYAAWQAANERLLNVEARADSPCRDCTPPWHRDMMAAGTCDGVPNGSGGRARKSPDDWRLYWRTWKRERRARVTP